MYKIEKNVPLIERAIPLPPKYPFGEMDIGDSFLIPISERNKASSVSVYWKKKRGFQFVSRKTGSGTEIRYWRVK